jgi:hypothetical protein
VLACRSSRRDEHRGSATIWPVAKTRLTAEECREIAERTMRSFESLDAQAALARFKLGEGVVNDVATDEATGKAFHRTLYAIQRPDGVVELTVSVSPEPHIVRHARRFREIADFIEGWRGARESALTTKELRPRP